MSSTRHCWVSRVSWRVWSFGPMLCLTFHVPHSCQYGHQQGGSHARQGRDGAVPRPGVVPRSAHQEGHQNDRECCCSAMIVLAHRPSTLARRWPPRTTRCWPTKTSETRPCSARPTSGHDSTSSLASHQSSSSPHSLAPIRLSLTTPLRTRREKGDRDVFNEKPTRDEMTIAAPSAAAQGPLGRKAVIHTTKGDIHIDLFPDQVPKTVENFVGLARKHYYDEVIFHRVIPKFVSLLVLSRDHLANPSLGHRCCKLEILSETVQEENRSGDPTSRTSSTLRSSTTDPTPFPWPTLVPKRTARNSSSPPYLRRGSITSTGESSSRETVDAQASDGRLTCHRIDQHLRSGDCRVRRHS